MLGMCGSCRKKCDRGKKEEQSAPADKPYEHQDVLAEQDDEPALISQLL